ncbi:MAG: hypothetical protein IID44_05435 [Planctomycetes bacterium]|nr:hypothetical protein [Planctomycetota bacterium]
MRRMTLFTAAVVAAAVLAAAGGCGRLAPAGPPAQADEVAQIIKAKFPDNGTNGPPPPLEIQPATGTTNISGRFVLAGGAEIPVPAAIAVCTPGGRAVPGEALLIDARTGGIKNVVVYLFTKNNSIGWSDDVPAPPEATPLPDDLDGKDAANQADYDQKFCVFKSHVFPLRLGQTLKIMNSDVFGHNTNITGYTNVVVPAGESVLYKFNAETSYPIPVSCNIHSYMKSFILPRENGYLAVTDKEGKFEIKNVPTGFELDFMVWHESAATSGPEGGRLVLDVDQKKNIKTLRWNTKTKGRFFIKLDPGTPIDFGKIAVPLSAFK